MRYIYTVHKQPFFQIIDKMEMKLEETLEKLIIAENPAQLLKQLIEDQTI